MAIDIRRVTRLAIGINTENGVEQYEFDMWPWIEEHPQLTHFQINVTPPGGGTPYIATTHMEGFHLVWPIAAHDTANTGDDGLYEIEAVGTGCHKLSSQKPLIVYERMGGTLGDAPDPMESWITQAAEIRDETQQAATRAENAADRAENAVGGSGGGSSGSGTAGKDGGYYQPYVSTSGYLTWTPSQSGMPAVAGANIKGPKGDSGATGPQGPQGSTGPAGDDGYSPTVTLTRMDNGVQIKATNKDGESTAMVYDGEDGAGGSGGGTGEDGGYYIPSVSSQGVLSWVGSKASMPSVDSTNIKGPKGDTGAQGPTGEQGPQGEKGATGSNGVSATHSWNGTTLTITSASGTSSANLKGAKGDTGDTGTAGKTPVRGTDYWTEADIATIKAYVDDAILNGKW